MSHSWQPGRRSGMLSPALKPAIGRCRRDVFDPWGICTGLPIERPAKEDLVERRHPEERARTVSAGGPRRMPRATLPQGLDGPDFGRSSFEARMQPSGCMLAPQDDVRCYAARRFHLIGSVLGARPRGLVRAPSRGLKTDGFGPSLSAVSWTGRLPMALHLARVVLENG